MMKTQLLSFRNVFIALLFFTFIVSQNLHAQDATTPPNVYFKITKVKDVKGDIMKIENQIMKPYVQERIKQKNQLAHILFRVHYPSSDDADYDFVILDIFKEFDHLHLGEQKMMGMAKTVFPHANIPKIVERFENNIKSANSEVFRLRDEAVPGPGGIGGTNSKFVQANYMKVAPKHAGKYQKMEAKIAKPVHQERIKQGKMHEWLLVERVLPYGSEFENNFITFDIFSEWGHMGPGISKGIMKKVHPNKDAANVWSGFRDVRTLTRAETWEVVAVVREPTPEIKYEVLNEGTGKKPMLGQEVKFVGKMMTEDGKELWGSEMLGFDFYATLGSNPYDRFFDKGLMKLGKGGKMKIIIPPGGQDAGLAYNTKGKNAIMKVKVLEIGEAKPDGSALLRKKIEKHGLSYAKEKYKKLQADNPKGYVFREGAMNMLGYELMNQGKVDEALFVFIVNQKNNPDSWNACDSLADGYMAKGDHSKAKHCYKDALKINPEFTAAKEKLAKLESSIAQN